MTTIEYAGVTPEKLRRIIDEIKEAQLMEVPFNRDQLIMANAVIAKMQNHLERIEYLVGGLGPEGWQNDDITN
jgi:hypothetical protein